MDINQVLIMLLYLHATYITYFLYIMRQNVSLLNTAVPFMFDTGEAMKNLIEVIKTELVDQKEVIKELIETMKKELGKNRERKN